MRSETTTAWILRVEPSQGSPFDARWEGQSMVIGRSSGAEISIPDRFLSRRHSRIFEKDGAPWLEDLGSHNGTLLNGRRIEEPERLQPGDRIQISQTVIIASEEGRPMPASPISGPGSPEDGSSVKILRDATMFMPRDPGRSPGAGTETALRRYADRLALLNEVHDALARSISLEELLQMILDRIFRLLQPQSAAVWLASDSGELEVAAARGELGSGQGPALSSKSLEREVIEGRKAALVLDIEKDARFAGAQSILGAGVQSLAAAPLLDDEKALGMIVLASRLDMRTFQEEDLELLVSLASVASLRLVNLSLLAREVEHQKLQQELSLARRIQERLLPKTLPEVPGYELLGTNVPSRGVSGDYYTVAPHGDGGAVFFLMADVSGKGIGASLLTASLEALAAGPIEVGRPPESICDRVSRRLYARTPIEKYATGLLGSLDPSSGRFAYCNAGHNAGLLIRRDGKIETLESTSPPLGLLGEAEFVGAEVTLEPGDLLVTYTDGITEAENPDGEELGLERLAQFCVAVRELPLEDVAKRLEQDVAGFVRGVPYSDDRTVMLLRRIG